MTDLEKKLVDFVEKICYNDLSHEVKTQLPMTFGEAVTEKFTENIMREEEGQFRLRMSAIGRPLRHLLLERIHGRKPMTPDMYFKMQFGHLAEAFLVSHMEYAGVNIEAKNEKVSLRIDDKIEIGGEYDIKIDGKIFDIKTASDWSYKNKFESYQTLMDGDSFGYMAQGFGYSEAANIPFGGWIVLNKNNSEFKVVEIPKNDHKWLREKYVAEIHEKCKHIVYTPDDIPPCEGVEEELFRGKPTGNTIVGSKCRFCPFKVGVCHKNITFAPQTSSKAKNPPTAEYIGDFK